MSDGKNKRGRNQRLKKDGQRITQFKELMQAISDGKDKIEYGGRMNDGQMTEMIMAMSQTSSLTDLSLIGTGLSWDAASSLSQALSKLANVKTMKLESNSFGITGVRRFTHHLRPNKNIESFSLLQNLVKDSCGSIRILLSRNKTIKHLNISHNENIGEGYKEILVGLQKNTVLTQLNFGSCKLGDVAVFDLCEMLKTQTTLREVDLFANGITDDGAEAIGKLLLQGSPLEKISLNQNRIGDVGIDFVVQGISKSSALKDLNLRENEYSSESAAKLKAARKRGLRIKYDDGVNIGGMPGGHAKARGNRRGNEKALKPIKGPGKRGKGPSSTKPEGKKVFSTEVGKLLSKNNLSMHAWKFYEERIHTLEVATELTNDDLKDLGISVLGDRVRLRKLFEKSLLPETVTGSGSSAVVKNDVFLSHNWGTDAEGRDNHARVSKVNEMLHKAGLKTWFDSEKLSGNIPLQMSRGIDNSQVVVVFITKAYMEKVNSDDDDNCKREFQYSVLSKSTQKIVAVVMEEGMRDTSQWRGLLGMELGNSLYVDMSTDELVESNMTALNSLITERFDKEEDLENDEM